MARPSDLLKDIPESTRGLRDRLRVDGYVSAVGDPALAAQVERIKAFPIYDHPSDLKTLGPALWVVTSRDDSGEGFHVEGNPTSNAEWVRRYWVLSEADAEAAVGTPLLVKAYDHAQIGYMITGLDERVSSGRFYRQSFTVRPLLAGEDGGWLGVRFRWLRGIQRTMFFKPK